MIKLRFKSLLAILLLAGCASGPSPVYEPLPAQQPRPVLPPLVYPPEPAPAVQGQRRPTSAATQPSTPRQYFLDWDWITNSGPVWFEVWTNGDLAGFRFAGGTNVPAGFCLWTNVPASHVPIPIDQRQQFFIVRAVNQVGPSDWAQ